MTPPAGADPDLDSQPGSGSQPGAGPRPPAASGSAAPGGAGSSGASLGGRASGGAGSGGVSLGGGASGGASLGGGASGGAGSGGVSLGGGASDSGGSGGTGSGSAPRSGSRQPSLHDLVTVVAAPTVVLSDRTGDVRGSPAPSAQGVLHADLRVLSRIDLAVDGASVDHLATELVGSAAVFRAVLYGLGTELAVSPDPQVRLDRRREVAPGRVSETLTVSSRLPGAVATTVRLAFAADLAVAAVLHFGGTGTPRPLPPPEGDRLRWRVDGAEVTLAAPGAQLSLAEDDTALSCAWPISLPARGAVSLTWSIEVRDRDAAVVSARPGPDPAEQACRLVPESGARDAQPHDSPVGDSPARDSPALDSPALDSRLRPWLQQSLTDLAGLRMALPEAPADVFYAAGSPWYLTLFGRDSLWAARMMLPLDVGMAAGTLRALARRQGRTVDPNAAEEPGKIAHELRRSAFAAGDLALPALYFGTIDATMLWICLLHDAWRAGMAEAEVVALRPALESALAWLLDNADADADGLVEYVDSSGHGLANQGWKDSADAVRFADGTVATGPIALCEVQGYAYEAAICGAALLQAFGDGPGAERCRVWAARLADRFRARFWCGEGDQRYPALALDGHKRRVDALTSNIGHLLGTGLLDAAEERLVARRVAGPRLDSGWGLRTMSDTDAGYSPLSYHCGSVWPHDTAIVIAGLQRAGLSEYAGGLVDGLLRASAAFDYRLPELWSGEGRPVPYPAACRPQAWSAAAAVVVAQLLTTG